ncbi:MAG: DMT family transporter [Pikeienuella sp.]
MVQAAGGQAKDTGGALVGVLCALGASTAFSLNDMGIKFLSGDYPLHQVVLVRASIGLLVTMAIFMPLEGGLRNMRTKRPLTHLLRGLCVVAANMTFFAAIAALPLADAVAIFFVAPLLITAMSVVILKEHVGPRRWAAILVGLLGVLIIVRPGGAGFQVAAVLPLIAATAYALLHIMTRRLGITESASTMAFYIQVTFVIVSGGIGLVLGDGAFAGASHPSLEFLLRAWVWPQAGDVLIMVGLGIASATGGYLISQAYRISEAGLIAPFEYTALIMAVFWGYLIWGEWPIPVVWVGIALVLASGIYMALREARVGARPSAKQASARRS